MVYRRKRGFSAPLWDYMRDDYMQAMVREVVLSPANPLRGSFKADFVRRIADKTRKHMVSFHAYHYLWGLIFLSGWWQQLPQRAKDR